MASCRSEAALAPSPSTRALRSRLDRPVGPARSDAYSWRQDRPTTRPLCVCALTLAPNHEVGFAEREAQTRPSEEAEEGAEAAAPEPPVERGPKTPLVYAEAISTQGDAAEAAKRLLAHVRDDHGSFPSGVVFRVPSDRG